LVHGQQEEEGAAAEQLPGQAAGRGSAHRVIGAAQAQHRHRRLVRVAKGLVPLPVALPAGGAAPGPAEEGFLQLPQRAAAQELVRVHHFGQSPHRPALLLRYRDSSICRGNQEIGRGEILCYPPPGTPSLQ
uniref:Uncharacterized protein n=1 Tax=Taeniopygia guttata TaxID=59729 RepID=A0A674HEZ4_TAEGU